ncbi:MAG: Rpn family recombination-promoting nuclease/putative transposase, partial [Prevotellaceae bacterium]|nr:Rpn family recombination-promoting nuclease/putative transposase [Prevotellaceae bacterium]
MTDFGFKKTFADKEALMDFLNSLLVLSEKIVDLEYLSPELFGYKKNQRRAAYDIHCKTLSGKHFIIEMQIAEQKYFSDRMLYYAALAIVNQAPKGKVTKINKKGKEKKVDWDYEISGVYIVAILDFVIFKEECAQNIIVEHVELIRKYAKLPFTNKYEFATVELPKFTKSLQSISCTLDQWLYTFRNMHKLQECPKEITNPIIQKIYKESKLNNLTGEEMETYRKSILEYDDVFHAVNWAREQSLKKGIVIGEKRGIGIGEKKGIEIGEKKGIEIGEKKGIEIGEKRGIGIGE